MTRKTRVPCTEDLLTLKEVSQRWPCMRERFLRRLRSEGRIASYDIGGRIYFHPIDIEDYIARHRSPQEC